MTRRSAELGALRRSGDTASAAPSKSRDPVVAFQELAKVKRGLPRPLAAEIERRKVTSVEEAERVALALRAKRVKSHRIAKPRKLRSTNKPATVLKPSELTRPGGKTARKAITSMKKALNSGVIKL
ncbi:ABC transporter ATP-binding protein [Babesia caballi]|uniref:ABC transporter ATP-binding protein n=1 Tax=Babesia caballi TaxID=5871 RepID=A0AAV4LU36_BABCB|nr:ABC transporter ATP-binding protein [Babesia caballi]